MPLPFPRRALTAAALAAVAAAGLAACGGATNAATSQPAAHAAHDEATSPAAHTEAAPPAAADATPVATSAVTIENFAFSPAAITVKAGTTVTWTNRDEEPHSVASSDEPMRSPTLAGQNITFSHTFAKPGRYTYNCGIPPFMHGTVEVTA
jgi:plastocyanin